MPSTEQKHEAQETKIGAADLQSILQTVLSEARKPLVDEDAAKRKERDRQRLKEQRVLSEQEKDAVESFCSHMREDGTSRIAWATNFHRGQGRYVTEGYCQACNKHYAEGVEGFAVMTKIPTGVRFTF